MSETGAQETPQKRRHGDRRDGTLLRDLDSMHFIVPMVFPNRCDNEAYISERIDLTALDAYLEKLNATGVSADTEPGADTGVPAGSAEGAAGFPYTLFHLIVTAMLKTITLRPKMNRFIVGTNTYQKNEVSASFVVKKQFADNGGEALAIIHSVGEDTLESVHSKIRDQVFECRSDDLDETSENMDIVTKLPRFAGKFVGWASSRLDKHGHVPQTFVATDPYYTSVLLSNLGSINLKCGYHHLANWGTNSVFVIVGEKKMRPYFNDDGTYEMKDSVDLGITIDERLADGYYYSKSIRLLKKLLEDPALLETPLTQEVEY